MASSCKACKVQALEVLANVLKDYPEYEEDLIEIIEDILQEVKA